MYFNLTNGETVNLRGNTEAAKFVYLVMPKLGLQFTDDKPTIKFTADVVKIHKIAVKLAKFRKARLERLRRDLPFDDDIPF